MPKLYVDKSVEIDASAARVWEILTSRGETLEWASEFSAGGPQLQIESDWTVGSGVSWKDPRGRTVVEGTVTAATPHALLRFTVFDIDGPRPEAGTDIGITFKLTERNDKTILWLSQGDFSVLPDGARYRNLSDAIWERALLHIRRLAEGRAAGGRARH